MHIVHAFEPGKIYMGRFNYGDDIIQTLERFCAEHHIQHGWINIIGALSKATISYYEQVDHKYVTKNVDGEYEIVSCSGNISIKDGKPFAHLHIVLSDTQYQTLGGHLMPATVSLFAGEFVLHALENASASVTPGELPNELSKCLIRHYDEQTGLTLW